jgi:hypothetical protein
MIRVGFVIGGYPPEEHKRRADVALSYSTPEIQVGIVDVAASPYFYGMSAPVKAPHQHGESPCRSMPQLRSRR